MFREALKDLKRARQIVAIAGRHGFADILDRAGVFRLVGSKKEQVEELPDAGRAPAAKRFRTVLNELGPTFVKFGQILSTRADLLPADFIEELATLQDQVPPMPIEMVHQQIREAFAKEPTELFREVDPTPLGSASIAQAHRAVTHEGEEVVVKVQRPDLTEQISGDLNVLRWLARLLEAVIEEVGVYTPTGIIEEFDRSLHEELDFLHEAANIRAFGKANAGRAGVRIPKVYDELTTRTVLTMEFLRGPTVTHLEPGKHDKKKIAGQLVDLAFREMFEDGLFHGDPHPGNLLVLDDGAIGLIDFGLVGRLSRQMQETLIQLALAIALKDSDSVARILYRIGAPDSRPNLMGFKQDVETMLGMYLPSSATLGKINTRHLLRDLLDLAIKYKVRVPKEYAILSRAGVALEGVLRSLHPEMDIGEVVMPYATQLLADQYDPKALQGSFMKTLLRLQGVAHELPTQLSQILLDLESGKFTANVRSEQLGSINTTLRSFAAITFLGLCACGFIVGAFVSFAQRPWTIGGVPVMGLLGVLFAGGLFGAAMAWYLLGTHVRKVSVSRWLKR